MIVEFIGLPGAGKSTAQRHLKERLAARGIAVEPEDELRSEYIRRTYARAYGRHHPLRRPITALYKSEIWTRHLGWCLRRGVFGALGSRPARLAGYWLTEQAVLARFCRQRAASVSTGSRPYWLLPQGFAHQLASCLVWGGASAVRFARFAPYSQKGESRVVIVLVDAPTEVALHRLQARGRPDTWPLSSNDFAVLAAFDVAITQTLDLVRSCNVRLERLDFSGDISTLGPALDGLAERLASLYEEGSP